MMSGVLTEHGPSLRCGAWFLVLSAIVCFGASCRSEDNGHQGVAKSRCNAGLIVEHSPTPCDVHAHPSVAQPPFPYMWYYKTTVTNQLSVPLRITWFEAYRLENGRWVAGNILGRPLTGKDFSDWFSDGVRVVDGVIPPGKSAVDGCNWSGSSTPTSPNVKWAYKAVDPNGVEYYAEATQTHAPIRAGKRRP